ncbi:MerR family transcriptional regulator [Hyphomonas sp. WL0036]|uniref:MerR family transcriptional regulator n=1 Tax=Hyphomonas sediminis TaxID=2866160 RepID=UPI001C7F20A8|nr:MerR family transcriptional regulator [Hyphomonas sediminis]MBY9067636.1 MerR family transcriptional regulator [Hyphomonas sediminis]
MQIGELAKRSGITHSRIRFYESIGLLKSVSRRSNGYRSYPPEALLLLDLIASAQKAGFSLDEIKSLIPPDLQNWEHDALIGALKRKISEIEALQARLARSKFHLMGLIREIEAKSEGLDCSENASRLIARMQGDKRSQQDLAPKADMVTKRKRPRLQLRQPASAATKKFP